MAIRREKIQLFSMSFLDVISCGFGAVLLVFLLVCSQAQRNAAAALEERSVVFTVQFRAEDADGQPFRIRDGEGTLVDYTPEGKVELVFPPKTEVELGESYPVQWIHRPTGNLSTLCAEASVTPRGNTLYGVFRGVKAKRFVLRFVLRSPPPTSAKLFVRGWIADPSRGHRNLVDAFLPESELVNAGPSGEELQISADSVIVIDAIAEQH